MFVSTLAALAMFAAQEPAQSAQSDAAPPAKSVEAKAEAPKKMCYTATPSGSRMPRKVCVTQAPSKEKDEKAEPKAE
jgi:hypothetical protein